MEQTQVSRIMVQNPVTTTPETPLVEVAVVLQKTKYGGLPVVTDGHLVGVITDSDLLRALVDILHAAAKTPHPSGGARSLSLPAREDADVVTSSDEYARRFAGEVGRFFLDVQAAVTLSLLRELPHARVLDVGGGHGQLAEPLLDAGHELTVLGSDPSCETRIRGLTAAGRARFVTADLLAPGLADRSFDVVLAFRLLPHVVRWPELVATLARLARRAVIVDYPTRRSVNAVAELLFGLKKGVEKDTRPFTVFRDAEIGAAFAASGFRAPPAGPSSCSRWRSTARRALPRSRAASRPAPAPWASRRSSARP